ncbi:hypothetical protein OPQ81_008659 [Rhizoctonia solani]|nr:hypothetical protein OPQ81_008659 [Rhizoctonia solani]
MGLPSTVCCRLTLARGGDRSERISQGLAWLRGKKLYNVYGRPTSFRRIRPRCKDVIASYCQQRYDNVNNVIA